MKPRLQNKSFTAFLMGVGLGISLGQAANANPSGATIVHGDVQFATPDVNTLNVTNSAGAIINWQSFSIGNGETTRFIQPSADSAVLNRVTGGDVSELMGNLYSNGHVFLINQNGIVFGQNAVIDTAGLVASTLNISDEDFLNHRFNFAGDNAGAIINHGVITSGPGGELVLIAPHIENHGVLSVENGALILAAGEKVKLTNFNLGGIEFEVQAPDNAVINLGQLIANNGAVGVFAGSIRHEGLIAANSIAYDDGGNIVLRALSDIEIGADALIQANGANGGDVTIQSETGVNWIAGTVEAIGEEGQGGDIKLLGEYVGVISSAKIDASGAAGGGEILVGGDYRGENPDIQNASGTFVGVDTLLRADALNDGDGGRVIVWGTDAARAYGAISARGVGFGNGGFVETSGHYLEVLQAPDVGSVSGGNGLWLLDPFNIDITVDSVIPIPEDTSTPGLAAFLAVDNNSTISPNLIAAALNVGTDVLIDTNSGSGQQAGHVNFLNGLSLNLSSSATLTVHADGDINFFSGIANSGAALNLDFLADRNADGIGGSININDSISTNGGDIIFRMDSGLNIGSGASVNAASVFIETYSAGRTIGVLSENGDLSIGESVLEALIADSVTIGSDTTSGILIGGGSLSTDFDNLLLLADGDIVLEDQGDDGGFNMDSFSTGNTLELRSLSGNIRMDNSANEIRTDGPGNVILNAANGSLDLGIISGGDVSLLAGGDIQLNSLVIAQNSVLIDSANGQVTQQSGFIVTSDLTVNAASGINISTNAFNLTYDNSGVGDVGITYAGEGSLTVSGGNNSGAGSVTEIFMGSGGNLFIDGAITGQGDIILRSDNIDINTENENASINAGPAARTILAPVFADFPWTLGGVDANFSSAELNRILNNIQIGDDEGSLVGVNIIGEIAFTQNQNFAINTNTIGDIFFNQPGTGISGANQVGLWASAIIGNGSPGVIDVQANRLDIITESGANMQTSVLELSALNTGSTGEIIIDNNSGTALAIVGSGVQNFAQGGISLETDGDIVIDNAIVSAQQGLFLYTGNGNGEVLLGSSGIINLSFGSGSILGTVSGAGWLILDNASMSMDSGSVGSLALFGNSSLYLIGPGETQGALTVDGGILSIDGDFTLSGVLNNNALGLWSGGTIRSDGENQSVFNNLAGGLLLVSGFTAMEEAEFTNAGLVQIFEDSLFNSYVQTAGETVLHGGSLTVMVQETPQQFDLLGGILSGDGAINVSLLNNAGGVIAPGIPLILFPGEQESPNGPQPDLPAQMVVQSSFSGDEILFFDGEVLLPLSIGTLTINGDLEMGANASIRLDIAGLDEAGVPGSAAGISYDQLIVTGNAALDGNLQLAVYSFSSYTPGLNDSYVPLFFQSTTGNFARIESSPPGYTFSTNVLSEFEGGYQGLQLELTGIPATRDSSQGLGRELDSLLNRFKDNLAELEKSMKKQDEEEEKRRREKMCS